MAYNRLLRWELFRSERFLSLPSDTHRLVFVALITEADDFGNLEGGARRLWRWMQSFAQVRLEQDAIKIMSDLQDSDLTRRYESEGREYWHIPRFRNDRRWVRRIAPASPWCDLNAPTSSGRNLVKNESKPAEDLQAVARKSPADRMSGVDVGVDVGVKKNIKPSRKVDAVELPEWLPAEHWSSFLAMRTKIKKPATPRAQRMLIGKLSELKDQGYNPMQVIAQAELNCWKSFYPPKEPQ